MGNVELWKKLVRTQAKRHSERKGENAELREKVKAFEAERNALIARAEKAEKRAEDAKHNLELYEVGVVQCLRVS